ncbi:MAG: VWA domain-containing protein [Acidobacteria bacterium]|nr:VWA domain-containing protein [Acidobacteriota bacterium]
MRFLSAHALWWLLLGAIIIFFYLLKLKRQRRVVPSVFLWQRALEEIEANAPFRKLRRSLLLLLQLLILAVLIFALARPLVKTQALATGSSIIIIDSTASMSATDEDGNTRLAHAKQLAREMIAGLGGSDRAAIIESSSRVTVRSALTSDRATLASAVNQIQETDAAGTLADALLLAEQLAKAERDASIVVISDGGGAASFANPVAPPTASRAAAMKTSQTTARSIAVRLVRVGRRAENVGIVALNSRASQANSREELFAAIANFSDQERQVNLELKLDGKIADARSVNLAAHDRTAVVFDALPQTGGLAELKLLAEDDLSADNIAYASLPDARKVRVAVQSDNPFLLQALAVNAAIEARKLTAVSAALDDFDCLITDGGISAEILASNKPLFAINPLDVAGWWTANGALENPSITFVDRAHPVNSFLSYADLHIEAAMKHTVSSWLKPVAQSGADGLIFAGDNKRKVVMVGFDLSKSDLPLKIEFPILLANSLAWLAGRDAVADERAIHAGQPVTVRAAAATTKITAPNGDATEINLRDGAALFADTLHAGLYEVKDAPPFAVSLLNEAESNTAPREAIQTRLGEVGGQTETFSSEREAWQWLLLAALVILAFEWWVYHRRIAA